MGSWTRVLVDVEDYRGRRERQLAEDERRKIALFTNVQMRAVISAVDVDNIYDLPIWLHNQGLDDFVVDRQKMKCN